MWSAVNASYQVHWSGLGLKTINYFITEECRKVPDALGYFLTSTLLGIYLQSVYEYTILINNSLLFPRYEGNANQYLSGVLLQPFCGRWLQVGSHGGFRYKSWAVNCIADSCMEITFVDTAVPKMNIVLVGCPVQSIPWSVTVLRFVLFFCVCVCVCVCERERERERASRWASICDRTLLHLL
jgi:hypothetical protein